MIALFKILAGLGAVMTLGVLALALDFLPGSAPSAERRLQESATLKLDEDTLSWASVTLNGQTAHLEGAAPSEEARALALDAVRSSTWGGGLILGGVTVIDDRAVTITPRLPLADPFLWIAERQGDSLVLSGYAPSPGARDDIIARAKRSFPDAEVSGALDIAQGAPREDRWVSAVFLSLDALARLEHGAIEANGASFTLSGEAAGEEAANAARLVMSALPQTMTGQSRISVAAPAEVAPAPTTAEIEASPAPAATDQQDAAALIERCRARLTSVIAAQQIGFASSRSALDAQSQTHLRAIADEMTACPQLSLRIDGHTDASGGAVRNQLLSEARADAVAAFLREAGVDARRLEAQGFGESQPLVSNATPEGRARNRRIDLTIFDPSTP